MHWSPMLIGTTICQILYLGPLNLGYFSQEIIGPLLDSTDKSALENQHLFPLHDILPPSDKNITSSPKYELQNNLTY